MREEEKEYLIDFDPGRCTQCHGCEIACKTWRDLPYGIQYRRVLNLWQGNYPEAKSASLSMACLHCADPACANACPEAAISKRETDGLVLVNETLCSGCGICAEACPLDVPQFSEEGIMEKCDLCCERNPAETPPPCIDTCPTEALVYVEVSSAGKKSAEQKIMRLLGRR